jgi:hypothetical protein
VQQNLHQFTTSHDKFGNQVNIPIYKIAKKKQINLAWYALVQQQTSGVTQGITGCGRVTIFFE